MFPGSGATANIKAVITADDKASSTLKGFGNNVDGMSAKMKAGFLAAGAAVVAFGVTSVKAFSESQDLIAQTNAVLKSTGGIAGVTADQVTKLATAWQRQTKFSDEAVRGAENILLTFTGITKDIFPQTTQAVLDISTALHEDLQSAAIQVGKALQDPVLGVTALRRVGVNFSEAQRDVIKNLVETGQKAQAQAIILKELQTEFGGSAKAAGETFSGKLTILKNRFNDVQESIGGLIVNGLFALMNFFTGLGGVVSQLAGVFDQFLKPSLDALFNTIKQNMPTLMAFWQAIEPGFTTSLKIFAEILGAITIATIWVFINVINVATKTISFIIGTIAQLTQWLGVAWATGVNAAKAIGDQFDWLAGVVRAVSNAIQDVINIAGKATSAVSKLNPASAGKSLLSHIPGFAEGGVVPGPTGQPTLAIVHGGETVIPTSGKGTGSVNITVNAGAYLGSQIDARKYAEQMFKALQDIAAKQNTSVAKMIGA